MAKIKTYYNEKHGITFTEKSKTKQEFIHSGNVAHMMQNMSSTELQDLALRNQQAQYADVSDLPESFAEAVNFVADVQHSFEMLPVELKQSIGNDWQRYPELFSDHHAQQYKSLYEKHGFMQKEEPKTEPPAQQAQSTEPKQTTEAPKQAPTTP